MKKLAFLFLISLSLRAFAALGEAPAMLSDGTARAGALEISMLDGGFYRTKEGQLYPGARLLFKYAGTEQKFHKNITVELCEAESGKRLASWKTFLSLKPGKSLDRRYGRESLGRWARVEEAPRLAMRVVFSKTKSGLIALPAVERHFGALPAEKAQLLAAKALDGDTLLVPDGQRIRLIGVDSPELVAEDPSRTEYGAEAEAFAAAEISRGAITVSYEGPQRDPYGRILAYVWLANGLMLNRELLVSGLARVDERFEFSYKDEFLKLQAEARKARKGLWGPRT